MENRTLTLVSMTTVSHSQVTSLTYNLGPVSHPGFEGRSELINPSNNTREDEIEFKVSLLISDHVMNTQGSFIAIATTLTGNNGVPSTGHTSVGVLVTETERPELIISFLMETFLHTQKMSGDNVTCTVLLRSTNTSTAHAQDVAVHVLTPPYVGVGQLIDAVDANVTVTTDPATGITFKISEIDFTDNVSFIFNLVLDPNRAFPVGLMHVPTVLPVDVTYRGAQRPDRADTGELYSDIIVKEFGFHTGSPAALGIESGTVQACQLTASSSRASNPPTQARLNGSGGWKPLVRGAPFCGMEYLQVDFGSSAYITGIRLQSSADDAQNVMTSFYVTYSEDSYAWYNVTDNGGFATKEFSINVPGNANVNDAYDITLNETQHFWTRYVRLVSTDTRCSVGARIELLGVKQASAPVVCATLETYVSPVPDQSYVVNPTTGTVFVCGLTQIHGEVACSRSDQIGAYWQAIYDNVGYVIGVIDNTSDVIAMSRDSTAHLLSEDDGITWDVLTNEHLAELLSQPGYVSATVFPYGDYRDVTVNTMYNNHGVNGPGFTLTGVMEGVAVKDGGPWNVLAWWGTQDWDLL
ncbi:uncharacterized protein LOC127881632 [Dreissena polymorpha]|uniref:uncharacterized protein LOC127881632 n=1 Tax=Dreissena polymorpha TaxID=45954 RepID=UPI00226492C0|nr:uncharacterized protein LOC127881632 [Dreissena polymorpha]